IQRHTMKKFFPLVILFYATAIHILHAQPVPYYRAIKATHVYTALTPTTGTTVTWSGPGGQNIPVDAFSADSIPLGFPFTMNGKTYTSVRPCSNGFVLLGGKTGSASEYQTDWTAGSAQ